jgi:hypothetical protein
VFFGIPEGLYRIPLELMLELPLHPKIISRRSHDHLWAGIDLIRGEDQSTRLEMFETGIKVIDLLAPYLRGVDQSS